jgi:hypothetical protein
MPFSERDPDPPAETERTDAQVRKGFMQRRREKMIAEIERNRRGEYKVPTWVMAVALVVIVAGWAALVFL